MEIASLRNMKRMKSARLWTHRLSDGKDVAIIDSPKKVMEDRDVGGEESRSQKLTTGQMLMDLGILLQKNNWNCRSISPTRERMIS